MWLAMLRQAVEASSRNVVAGKLGISRTAVSLILNDKYPASTDRIARRVMDLYGRVQCPFLAGEISHGECRAFQQREAPISSPREMRHWRTCKSCTVGAPIEIIRKEAA